jgi:hypothetical protein
MLYGIFGNFMKDDAGKLCRLFAYRFSDVVPDSLTLTVLIGRDKDCFSLFGKFL